MMENRSDCTRFSVIIPTLNERPWINATVRRVRALDPSIEIVVVDGGSTDGTRQVAERAGAAVVNATRGRGHQCAAGAKATDGDMLIFLHADSWLSDDAIRVVKRAAEDSRFRIGSFRLRFDCSHWLLRSFAWMSRFDTMFTRFGDQGIIVRRSFLERLGGFPEQVLFEDVELLKRARHYGEVQLLPATLVTSSRRFMQIGVVRTQLLNAWLMLRFATGTAPDELNRQRASFYGRLDGTNGSTRVQPEASPEVQS